MKQGNLPDGFPAKDALEAGGVTTFAQARKFIDGDEAIDGIGPATEEKIAAALNGPNADAADSAPETETAATNDGADVISESTARAEAIDPGLKQARLETNAEKLANSRFCFYDDPEGPFVADADTVNVDDLSSKRVKVMPISLAAPVKGLEVRDSGDVYVITEDMMAENVGDWLKVRSPVTGLPLIR